MPPHRASAAASQELLLQQDRYRPINPVGHGEIEFAIAIEICRRHLVRTLPDCIRRTRRLGEGSVAVAEQKGDCAISIVCNREVQLAIVIEVPCYDRLRPISYRDRGWRPKRSIAVSQQDEHGVANGICHCEIQLPILVKVGGHDGGEILTKRDRRTTRQRECSISVPKRYGYPRARINGRAAAGHDCIQLSVCVEIPHRHTRGEYPGVRVRRVENPSVEVPRGVERSPSVSQNNRRLPREFPLEYESLATVAVIARVWL